MDFQRATFEIRNLFWQAHHVIAEEIFIKKDYINFLKARTELHYQRDIILEENHLQILEEKLVKYYHFSELLLIHEQYENITIGQLRIEHISFPQNEVIQQDIDLIKNLSHYCNIHDSTICLCNNLMTR